MCCGAWQRHPCVELEILLAPFPGAANGPHRLSTERIVGAPYDAMVNKIPHVKACCSSSLASLTSHCERREVAYSSAGQMPSLAKILGHSVRYICTT